MSAKYFLLPFAFAVLCCDAQSLRKTDSPELFDLKGRLIRSKTGENINYSEKESSRFSAPARHGLAPQTPENGAISCDPLWKFTVMGTNIGGRSLRTLDLEHDGKLEVIASASYYGNYFYTLQYDPVKNTYDHSWVSGVYNDNITSIKCFDLNGDSIYEIFVGFSNGNVREFDGLTKKQVRLFSVPTFYGVYDIEWGDADNDGTKELVISDEVGFYFIETTNFTISHQFNSYGTFDFKIGNIDNDPVNEMILSNGNIVSCINGVLSLEWMYESTTSIYGYIELADLDQDGKQEFVKAEPWNAVKIYDGDIQSLKFSIATSQDIGALTLVDINNDGIDEIIYGDGQWGKVHCINATTHAQMWTITNINDDFTGISVADIDQNGDLEIMWGSGQNSTGGDTLYIYDVTTKAQQWKSKDIDGPFYGIDIADVDNDGSLEVVTVSQMSASSYNSGIISVFDANTHNLEWQCGPNFIPNTWTGIWDVKINDIDNDGVQEIILATGDLYTGAIYIINGVTKAIKSSHVFSSENLAEFYTLDVGDVDNNGTKEIVAVGSSLYIINPVNFGVIWTSPFGGLGSKSRVRIANVDGDANNEVVVVGSGKLYALDGVTHQYNTWTGQYNAFDIYDLTGDNTKDIISGTSNGNLVLIDVLNNQVIQQGSSGTTRPIEGIHADKMTSLDTAASLLFTIDGLLYLRNQQQAITAIAGTGTTTAGPNNSLVTFDVDNDGNREIFVGTGNSVYELGYACVKCASFSEVANKRNVSCVSSSDGSVALTTNGGTPPYTYQWSTGASTASIVNLSTGTYYVTITDNGGCALTDSIVIKKAPALIASLIKNNINCQQTNLGSASASVIQGTAPYTYIWSNGASGQSLSNLGTGTYSVIVRDTMLCADTLAFTIGIDSIKVNVSSYNVKCFNSTTGYISAYVAYGQAPYQYQWSTGQTNYYSINGLAAGSYTVGITDARGCIFTDTIIITSPPALTHSIKTTPADASIGGTATINESGGTPPYSLLWSDPYAQTSPVANNLTVGTYSVLIKDANNCSDTAFAIISVASNDITLFPNPSTDIITVRIGNNKPATMAIYDELGRKVYAYAEFYNELTLYTRDFSMGNYLLEVHQADNTQTRKFLVTKKP